MIRIISHRSLLVAAAIAFAPFALPAQATAGVTCKDGTASSATGRGACSGHGGVAKAAKAAKSEAKADAKIAKADAKADAKAAKATDKAISKAAVSDVKETGKTANATVARGTRTAANTDPTNATAKCKDGTYSHAATHRGACSRHGGVAEWLKS
jgi:hypothetical protein